MARTRPKVYLRRHFVRVGAVLGIASIAGCLGDGSDAEPESSDESSGDDARVPSSDDTNATPNFRLLISDQPADIGDFDRLDVTFDGARIFGDAPSDVEDDADDDPADDDTADQRENDTETVENGDDNVSSENTGDNVSSEDNDVADGGEPHGRGFYELDLPGDEDSTVDLTEVIGTRATSIFEGRLAPGQYRKIELSVASVDAELANGQSEESDDEDTESDDHPVHGQDQPDEVEVKVPSDRLQLTKPFEIDEEGQVDFVFDINVVRRGRTGRYNLLPVISQSGVAGRDVEVEEVQPGNANQTDQPSNNS